MPENKKQITFNVFVEPVEGTFVAYCLETGIVATSKDPRDVFSKIVKLNIRQVEFAMRHQRLSDVYRAAPGDVFVRYLTERTSKLGFNEECVQLEDGSQGGLVVQQTAYATA